MPLTEYRRKRRFSQTPEPQGRPSPAPKAGRSTALRAARKPQGKLRFVVQEHHARRTHWDFRLEMGGVLKSWAVPKGPTLDPDEKRLAVPVEDHPLQYWEFEGVIPAGNYGAGTVMVWDTGTYEMVDGQPLEGYQNGKLTITLQGKKLIGEFHLVRTRMRGEVQWLMFKKRDGNAVTGWTLPSPSISVKTGRTIEQITVDASAQWQPERQGTGTGEPFGFAQGRQGNRGTENQRKEATKKVSARVPALPRSRVPASHRKALAALRLGRGGKDPFPSNIKPTLATLAENPFDDPSWMFEIKWDGIRAIAYVRHRGAEHQVTLRSRGGLTVNQHYPEIVEALYELALPDVVLDGEIVALDPRGRSQFQLLQPRMHRKEKADASRQTPIAYYAFDLLYLDGHLLVHRPLAERRRALETVLPRHPLIRLSEAVPAQGRTFYKAAQALGVEGIVGKRRDSEYHPGKRTPAWVKIKVKQRLEAVIGGYTEGRRARRPTFGALLLGAYDSRGTLTYIGHCGSGFTDAELQRLLTLLRARADATCPFGHVPETNEPATWVRPELVAEIEYGGWTADRLMRIPVYEGLRDDKPARKVKLEGLERREPGTGNGERMKTTTLKRKTPTRTGAESRVTSHESRPAAVSPGPLEKALAGVPVEFTNLDKVFWPERGYTKGDLIMYYLEVSKMILPHLQDRPVTLRRFPNGIIGESFYQKDYPDAPEFVHIVKIWTESGKSTLAAPVSNNLATLLWLAQLADIEIHTWFSRITSFRREKQAPQASTEFAASQTALWGSVLNRPDYVVFDIDPYIFPDGKLPVRRGEKDPDYSRRGFDAATDAALLLRELLATFHLKSFVKTSGKTGLHVFVPVARRYTFEQTHAFAKAVTQYLETKHPQKVTTEWAAAKRVGKVFLDYNQNRLGATLASAYSVRPTPDATVSMPLTWKELTRRVDPLEFTLKSVPDLMRRRRDPWEHLLAMPQRLEEHLEGRK